MKNIIFKNIFIVILCLFVVFAMYIFMYYAFDSNIERDTEQFAQKLTNTRLESLLNGSGINNIPNLNIISTNLNVKKANACNNGPVHIGDSGTDKDCVSICANSSASVINVKKNESYMYENTSLKEGANCIIGPRPECNMKTTYALMTINSVVCRSKFPEIVGGPLGTTPVACNNKQINDPQNYLYDFKNMAKYDPLTTIVTDINERLPGGRYRFGCRFYGTDVRMNRYMKHPIDRLHPIRNYCASEIYAAHSKITTNLGGNKILCHCGSFEETRVKHLYPGDKTSICSPISFSDKPDVKNRHKLTIPYKCFTLFSPISDVGKLFPCPPEKFTKQGSNFDSVTLKYAKRELDLIEHPMYEQMKDGTVAKLT